MQIDTLDCSETELAVTLKDGRLIAAPLWWLPRLWKATPEQRARWQIMPFGDAIEWQEIDEHVSVKACCAASQPEARRSLELIGSKQLPPHASSHPSRVLIHQLASGCNRA